MYIIIIITAGACSEWRPPYSHSALFQYTETKLSVQLFAVPLLSLACVHSGCAPEQMSACITMEAPAERIYTHRPAIWKFFWHIISNIIRFFHAPITISARRWWRRLGDFNTPALCNHKPLFIIVSSVPHFLMLLRRARTQKCRELFTKPLPTRKKINFCLTKAEGRCLFCNLSANENVTTVNIPFWETIFQLPGTFLCFRCRFIPQVKVFSLLLLLKI